MAEVGADSRAVGSIVSKLMLLTDRPQDDVTVIPTDMFDEVVIEAAGEAARAIAAIAASKTVSFRRLRNFAPVETRSFPPMS